MPVRARARRLTPAALIRSSQGRVNKPVTETEIKLRVEDPPALRRQLGDLGWQPSLDRALEKNWVYDRPDSSLSSSGYLLRVRQTAGRGWLTVKGPVRTDAPHKIREEIETKISDPEAVRGILETLGFEISWRYEKFRTAFGRKDQNGKILLDETPIGNFLELEGEPGWIDETARLLGFTSSDYVTASYRTLFLEHARSHRGMGSDMVFAAIL